MWNLKNKINKQTKQLIDTENRLVVVRGEEAWGLGKIGDGVNCMLTNGKQIYCGDQFVVYTKIELLGWTPETHVIY